MAIYQSKYFKPSEFRCKGPECKNQPDPIMAEKLLIVLDKMRECVGKQIIVNCGYRCKIHDAAVGGVNGQHPKKTAADITWEDFNVDEAAKIAEQCGADGIGKYHKKHFVHVDVRGVKARWDD